VLKKISSILLSIVSTFCLGNIDSTFIEVPDTQDIIIKNPNINNELKHKVETIDSSIEDIFFSTKNN
jgi:hypothetical protein